MRKNDFCRARLRGGDHLLQLVGILGQKEQWTIKSQTASLSILSTCLRSGRALLCLTKRSRIIGHLLLKESWANTMISPGTTSLLYILTTKQTLLILNGFNLSCFLFFCWSLNALYIVRYIHILLFILYTECISLSHILSQFPCSPLACMGSLWLPLTGQKHTWLTMIVSLNSSLSRLSLCCVSVLPCDGLTICPVCTLPLARWQLG